MSLQQLHRVIASVISARDLEADWTQKFIYVTYPSLTRTGPCEVCEGYEADVMSRTEIYNAFNEYLEDNGDVILPHVHPNCVCELRAVAEEMEIPPETKKLSDEEFDDWLTGLLSAGYIAAAVYDLIMARRKQKKKAESQK